MSFKVSEQDISGYYREGYVVFRQVLEPALVNDLRKESDKAAEIVRKNRGPQVQRLQPVQSYAADINMRPFKDYAEHPGVRAAMDQVLSPEHYYGKADILGILLNPADQPWCTHWHRDITLESSRLPADEFDDLILDWNSVNQINCPLYDDDCTWFVPGSHLRSRNLPGEAAAVIAVENDDIGQASTRHDPVTKERICWNYTAGMPGAVQLRLNAGDFAMYRPVGWHIGNYVPYKKRATLHDGVFTKQYEEWWRPWISGGSPSWKKKLQAV